MGPVWLRHGLPFAECVQAEIQQPLRLFLFGRNHAHYILVQPFGDELLLYVRHKTFLVFGLSELLYDIICHKVTKIVIFCGTLTVSQKSWP